MLFTSAATVSWALADAAGTSAAPSVALAFALHWLLVCLLCALLWAAVAWGLARRRVPRSSAHLGPLFVAFALVAFAGSCLLAETREVALRVPLLAMLVPVLFPLFYYLFSDDRYASRWTRWLAVLYALGEMGALIPPKPPSPRSSQILAPAPGLLGALGLIGDIWAVTVVVLGILPQLYARARTRRAPEPSLAGQRRAIVLRGVLLLLIGALALTVTGLFSITSPLLFTPAFLAVRTVFFLLATLVPVALAFMLLRRPRYDRDAVANRLFVSLPLTVSLIGIYLACALVLVIFFPGFARLPSVAYLPFVLLIALVLAAAFRPLRGRLQTSVDRRFFRRKYNAAQVLATFQRTLGQSSHLNTLSTQLVAGIEKALQPDVVALWLCTLPERVAYRGTGLVAMPVPAGNPAPTVSRPGEQRAVGDTRLQRHSVAVRPDTAPVASTPDLTLDDALCETLRWASSGLLVDHLPDGLAARALRAGGAALAVPLVADGDLAGMVTLGTPAGASSYTADERALLAALMDTIAPTLRAVQWEHEQEARARARERVEQELRTARRIQEALLPKAVPTLDGWQLATHYRPAREVGGDFYDFISLPDGRLGLVLGDVTDKGMPAALVMATTRSMLRAVASQPSISPGQALAHVNELLCPDLPAGMFVTCFYGILDPVTGYLRFANAGQDLPCLRRGNGTVCELYATGMPLGLMPGMRYEERDATLAPNEGVLFYSDGIVEAHNPAREMFGFPRLRALLTDHAAWTPPIARVLHALTDFTGAGWEQEDDITLVTLQRLHQGRGDGPAPYDEPSRAPAALAGNAGNAGSAGDAGSDETA